MSELITEHHTMFAYPFSRHGHRLSNLNRATVFTGRDPVVNPEVVQAGTPSDELLHLVPIDPISNQFGQHQ
jgi:hypothetical protein